MAAAVAAVLLALVNVGAKDESGVIDPFLPVAIMVYLFPQAVLILVGASVGRLIGIQRAANQS